MDWDPLETLRVNEHMDYICYDMPWSKSPIDMALWDIQGKVKSGTKFSRMRVNIWGFPKFFSNRQI